MMQVFPLFQKWNFIYKTRYGDHCFIIPFLWHFWNKKFLFLKFYFLCYHQWENLHKIYERILFLIFTLCSYHYHIISNLNSRTLDDVVKTFFFSQFTNEAVESPDHKTHHSFSVKCLWNVQIQILNLPKRPS